MLSISKTRITVLLLRASVLVSKFLFTLILASVLSIDDFGLWILIFSGISYGQFLLGLELYNVTLRNYASEEKFNLSSELYFQWKYILSSYLALTLISILLYSTLTYDSSIIFCALILVAEHFTLEMHRLAIYRNDQFCANIILFIKTVCWMLPLSILIYTIQYKIDLNCVLIWWLVGSWMACIYCVIVYRVFFNELFRKKFELGWQDFSKIFKQVRPFLILAICIRTPLIMDRYAIEYFYGLDQVAIYGYYMSFASGLQSLYDAFILSHAIPLLLYKNNNDDKSFLKKYVYNLIYQSGIFWLSASVLLLLIMPYFNSYFDKQLFDHHLSMFAIILGGQMLFSFGVIMQYLIYSYRNDFMLMNGSVLYFVTSMIMLFVLVPSYGAYGATVAILIASAFYFFHRKYQMSYIMRGL